MEIRYVNYLAKGKFRQPVFVWYKIRVRSNLEGIATFFVHRLPQTPMLWTVSEEKTGLSIGGEHSTRHASIAAARDALNERTVDAFKDARDSVLKTHGCLVGDLPDVPVDLQSKVTFDER